MVILPGELYNRCRDVLLQCSEFDNDAALRSVFVTDELYPFRGGLPEATTKNERVDKTLDYLLSNRLSDGQSVFLIFVIALRDRHQTGDALRDDLVALVEAIQSALVSPDLPSTAPHPSQSTASFTYNTKAVRDLLTTALDDEGLTALCYDHFSPVYDDLSAGMGKRQKIQRLLDYCERHVQMEKLLSLIEERNPVQYARFKDLLQ